MPGCTRAPDRDRVALVAIEWSGRNPVVDTTRSAPPLAVLEVDDVSRRSAGVLRSARGRLSAVRGRARRGQARPQSLPRDLDRRIDRHQPGQTSGAECASHRITEGGENAPVAPASHRVLEFDERAGASRVTRVDAGEVEDERPLDLITGLFHTRADRVRVERSVDRDDRWPGAIGARDRQRHQSTSSLSGPLARPTRPVATRAKCQQTTDGRGCGMRSPCGRSCPPRGRGRESGGSPSRRTGMVGLARSRIV